MRLSGAIDSGDPDMNRLFNSAATARDEDLPDMSSLLMNVISGDSRNVFLVRLLRELVARKVAARLGADAFTLIASLAASSEDSRSGRQVGISMRDICVLVGCPIDGQRRARNAIAAAESEGWLTVSKAVLGSQSPSVYRIAIPGEYELSEEQGQWCTD